MAREGHGFNVFQSENDPALSSHNNVTLPPHALLHSNGGDLLELS